MLPVIKYALSTQNLNFEKLISITLIVFQFLDFSVELRVIVTSVVVFHTVH